MNNSQELSREEKLKLVAEYAKQAESDLIVFVDRFLYTFNPKVEPYHFAFKLFPFQKDFALELKKAIEKGEDRFIDKSREMGATYTTLAVFLWFWRYVEGSNFLLGSRKEDLVDNRSNTKDTDVSNKEESLFGKLDYMLKKLPGFMLPRRFDLKKHNGYMNLLNPENGNVISGESSNPDFSRGARYKAILLDEFAFWQNDTSAWGATADTTNCRIVLTTPGIRPGKAKRLRFGKDGEKIKVIELDKSLDPRKDAAWEARERQRRSAQDYAREIERNWETSVLGRVYDEVKYALVGKYPYNPVWPLYVTWDFGLDGTAIQFWQINMQNGKKRLADCYFNEDKPIQFFFPLFGRPIDSLFVYELGDTQAIDAVKYFKKAVHFGDPDVAKRSYQSKDVTSTRLELQNVGIYIQTKPEANQFYIRREKTKVLLQNGIEVNDTPRTEYFMEAIRTARYPERTEISQATTPVNLPIHDWTSHHRTALEYFAVNYDPTDDEQSADIEQPEWAHNTPSWAR